MERIAGEILTMPIEGINLSSTTLGDLIHSQPTLLVFLRHFG